MLLAGAPIPRDGQTISSSWYFLENEGREVAMLPRTN